MKKYLIIPAFASLALLAANPTWALAPTVNLRVASTDHTVVAGLKSGYDCRVYASRWARQRCDVIHGQPTPY